jgi:membrane-associated protease RseP (regulator of RpoE activity)
LIIAVIALVLVSATMVHEAGHLVAVRLKGGRVLEVRIGHGPKLWDVERSGTVYAIRLLPLGGRIVYQDVREGTAVAVVAISGAIANVLAALVLLGAGVVVFGLDHMPYGAHSDSGASYAIETVGAWLWLLPRSLADLGTIGSAPALRDAVGTVTWLLDRGSPRELTYFAAVVSTLWAVLNLIPVPGSDGARLIRSLLRPLLPGRETA